jgi:BRCA1 C Terminus (BRCT) domain
MADEEDIKGKSNKTSEHVVGLRGSIGVAYGAVVPENIDASKEQAPQHKRRRRFAGSKHARELSIDSRKSNKTTNKDRAPKQSDAPLRGVILAVSTQSSGSANEAVMTYKSVCALCTQAGASVSGQVHKKVDYVIATAEAAGRGPGHSPTQRVRKAWKRHIPVASVEWLRDCCKDGRLIPLDQGYIWNEIDSEHAPVAVEQSRAVGKLASVERHEEVERKIDLGCCCVCHDEGSQDCKWCVDCSVNRSADR